MPRYDPICSTVQRLLSPRVCGDKPGGKNASCSSSPHSVESVAEKRGVCWSHPAQPSDKSNLGASPLHARPSHMSSSHVCTFAAHSSFQSKRSTPHHRPQSTLVPCFKRIQKCYSAKVNKVKPTETKLIVIIIQGYQEWFQSDLSHSNL